MFGISKKITLEKKSRGTGQIGPLLFIFLDARWKYELCWSKKREKAYVVNGNFIISCCVLIFFFFSIGFGLKGLT